MVEARDDARRLIAAWPKTRTLDGRRRTLAALRQLYDGIAASDPDTARDVRVAVVRALRDDTELATDEHLLHFLHAHVEPEDFKSLRWDDADHVIAFCEQLYSIQLDTPEAAERIEFLVGQLLREVLQEYERKRRHESMFRLVRFAPSLTTFTDAELFRLRHRTYLYEMRRVRRNRNVLYGYLAVQAVLVLFLFPVLFVYAENGAIQQRLERATGVSLAPEQHHSYTYQDGLYWSLVTAGTVGYGDITPETNLGRGLAAVLGVMGVLTSGVVAGLILQWIVPRQLDG